MPERSGWQDKGSTPVGADQPPPIFKNSQFFFEYRKDRYRYIRQLQHRLTAIKLDESPVKWHTIILTNEGPSYFEARQISNYWYIFQIRRKDQTILYQARQINIQLHPFLTIGRRVKATII
ncbi:hypothetical protein KY285_033744 [Solanum tuberosum]|nr:hypothetical protein KY284_033586 [Solanum tuberosum]KAH0648496.1 hypothetical protein KY285_033744 [Solanum tuberosum]